MDMQNVQASIDKTYTLDRMSAQERIDYDRVLGQLEKEMAERALSRFEAAKQSGIPAPTLNPWMDGTTKGNYAAATKRVQDWLNTLDGDREVLPETQGLKRPGYIETIASKKIMTTLRYTRAAGTMALITCGTGMGKTTTAEHYADNHANVIFITLDPLECTATAIRREIAYLAKAERERGQSLTLAIGKALTDGKKSLIIIDEAQYLKERTLNMLRSLNDKYGIGLALLGNEDIFKRLRVTASQQGAGQIQSRFSKRVFEMTPIERDIATYIDAWGITDAKCRELLMVIGRKTGSLRQVCATIEGADIVARGSNREITAELLRKTWFERTTETLK